jgi:2-keto-4-pentenoate hydratase/2-oxohepta-3-ene-1,7-dioic acid hydratase in catechol pathway
MLIAAFATPAGPQYGLVIDGMLHEWNQNPLTATDFTPGRVLMPVDQVSFAPPVFPTKIVAIGRNYAAHAAEHQAEVPTEPMLFLKPSSALIPHKTPIRFSPAWGRIDHEAELAVIIKRPAYRVSREDALDYVLGYTCANDVSARDYQKKDGQWGRAKGFDTFCPLGPFIQTDLDPTNVRLRALVNGEVKQDSTTANMVFDVRTLISFISHVMTLAPGDLILTGTPEGVSPINDGDVVQIEIEGIGTLENPVKTF